MSASFYGCVIGKYFSSRIGSEYLLGSSGYEGCSVSNVNMAIIVNINKVNLGGNRHMSESHVVKYNSLM